jgi:hypothetical protein
MFSMAIAAALALLAGIIACLGCDKLVRLAARSESALSNVEALLKARHDLVPMMIEAMRDHACE